MTLVALLGIKIYIMLNTNLFPEGENSIRGKKKKGIVDYKIEEAIEDVNRKAVGMVNLRDQ